MASPKSSKGKFFSDDATLTGSIKSHLARDNFKAENVYKPKTLPRTRRVGITGADTIGSIRKRKIGLPDIKTNYWFLNNQFGQDGPRKLIGGSAIAICPNQDIAVVDLCAKCINVYTKNGKFRHSFTTSQDPKSSGVSYPRQMVVDRKGTYFLTDETQWVKKFNPQGDYIDKFPVIVPQLKKPSDTDTVSAVGLTMDVNGNLLIGEVNKMYICKHTQDGKYINNFKVSIEPVFLAVTPGDDVIICACHMDTGVQIVDSTGQLLQTLTVDLLYTLTPSNDRWAPNTDRWYPTGICYKNGIIYICNYEIYCFSTLPDEDMCVSCVTQEVDTPVSLAITEDKGMQKLLVVDQNGTCVKLFTLDKHN